MQYEISHQKNYDFVNQDLKDRLVPILDAEADVMFHEDFTRLHPSMHWARAYRDSTRWGTHTPDIDGALKLMKEFEMEWSTDRESWGGNWKFKSRAQTSKPRPVEEVKEIAEQEAEPVQKPLENLALHEQGLEKHTGAMEQELEKQQSHLKETEVVHSERQLPREQLRQERRKDKITA